jgi:hypothetical protein
VDKRDGDGERVRYVGKTLRERERDRNKDRERERKKAREKDKERKGEIDRELCKEWWSRFGIRRTIAHSYCDQGSESVFSKVKSAN